MTLGGGGYIGLSYIIYYSSSRRALALFIKSNRDLNLLKYTLHIIHENQTHVPDVYEDVSSAAATHKISTVTMSWSWQLHVHDFPSFFPSTLLSVSYLLPYF